MLRISHHVCSLKSKPPMTSFVNPQSIKCTARRQSAFIFPLVAFYQLSSDHIDSNSSPHRTSADSLSSPLSRGPECVRVHRQTFVLITASKFQVVIEASSRRTRAGRTKNALGTVITSVTASPRQFHFQLCMMTCIR